MGEQVNHRSLGAGGRQRQGVFSSGSHGPGTDVKGYPVAEMGTLGGSQFSERNHLDQEANAPCLSLYSQAVSLPV